MNTKRILSFSMAAVMMVGSSLTVFATEPTPATTDVTTAVELTGTGSSAYVDKNVMQVVVPTANFNYKIDPEGVMSEVKSYDGTAVTSVTDNTGVIFLNTGADSSKTVSNYSDAFTITNKSAVPVDLGVTYYVEDGASNPIAVATALSAKADLSDNKAIYLGLIPYGVDKELAFTATNTTKTNFMLLSAEDAYKVTDTSGTYSYAIDTSYAGTFPTISFYLTGAINKDIEMSTWYYDDKGTRKPKTAPKINFKYTLTSVKDSLPAIAIFSDDDLYVSKGTDNWATGGGFADHSTTPVTAITVNGRTVTPAATNVVKLGDTFTTYCVKVPMSQLAPLFGYTGDLTEEDKATIKSYVKAVTVAQGPTYYGEVAQ
ncbi:hypothetical protein [Butyrivibrio sp. AE3004]|uniref:hypothetical protein n=1 Tax=Butyrivibrio sp. AE3004 TaxID=1506994 RepID=UPI000494813E|nr:hypothetical protein [Butyrivibrio sp. AE3004]